IFESSRRYRRRLTMRLARSLLRFPRDARALGPVVQREDEMSQYNLGFAWALLWALTGCGGGGSTDAPPGSEDPVSEVALGETEVAAPDHGLPETAEELKPRLFAMGGGPSPVRSVVVH